LFTQNELKLLNLSTSRALLLHSFLPSFLASNVDYHFGDLHKALTFEIKSGDAFAKSSTDKFTATVVANPIKTYIQSFNTPIPGPLEALVRAFLTSLVRARKYSQVLWLAIKIRF
jgi:hypothetical protein